MVGEVDPAGTHIPYACCQPVHKMLKRECGRGELLFMCHWLEYFVWVTSRSSRGWYYYLNIIQRKKKNSLCLVTCTFSPGRTQTSFAHQLRVSRLSEPTNGYWTRSECLDCGTQFSIVLATAGVSLQWKHPTTCTK